MDANRALNDAAAKLDALARNLKSGMLTPEAAAAQIQSVALTIRENGGS